MTGAKALRPRIRPFFRVGAPAVENASGERSPGIASYRRIMAFSTKGGSLWAAEST